MWAGYCVEIADFADFPCLVCYLIFGVWFALCCFDLGCVLCFGLDFCFVDLGVCVNCFRTG